MATRLTSFLIFLIRQYQQYLSPQLPPMCRFRPTCSHYAIAALEKYGLLNGGGRSLWRFLRCHPWHPGGYDPLG